MTQFSRGARVGPKDDGADFDDSSLIDAGRLFSSKGAGVNAPVYHGFGNIGGERYKIKCHWRSARNGERFLKISFTKMAEPPARERPHD